MSDSARIRAEVEARGISRLCHFTASRNLAHILSEGQGLLASSHLRDDERAVFNPTDLKRLDGYTDHVCCSVQFPNAWNFRKVQVKERVFCDWVVLFLDPRYLWHPGTKFCPTNASRDSGSRVEGGFNAFRAVFAHCVEGDRLYTRGRDHPEWLPTDEQAEVLIPDRISARDIMGIAVRGETQAKRESARLRTLCLEAPPFVLVPEFYDTPQLSRLLRSGRRPVEQPWPPGGKHDG